MAAGYMDKGFKLVTPDPVVKLSAGDDVTLPCHLSSKTSAVAMEIRWFNGTDCIYLYKNGHVAEGRGYEGRVSVNTQKLQRGDVSLILRDSIEGDGGVYTCQVISGEHKEEGRVGLRCEKAGPLARLTGVLYGWAVEDKMKREITDEERKMMEESVQSLVLRPWRKATDDELMKKINQLENKTSEVEKTKQELEEKNKLLQETETDLENMTKREKEREGLLENMTSELETSIRQLESLEKELQDRNSQLQDLRTQLQEQGRELEERDRQLEERNRQLEERERQLEQRNRQLEEREREQLTDPGPPPIRRSGSNDNDFLRPNMGGESPGPAPPVSPAVSELRLVLLGGSTAGKRAAGNTILGTEEFGRQASTLTHTSTETQHSESRQGEVAGRRVTVVETPDWFCSGLSEKDLRQDVGLCVRLSAPGPHAFLLVIPVEPSEGEEMRMLEKMEDMFGEGCWGHTLILFTNAEGLGERSVEELLQTGSQELQQLVEKCGNRCHLLNVKDRPDDTKITQLLQKIDEIVSGKRDRFYSSQTYQEAEKQVRKIERRIQQEQEVEERKLMEEIEKRKELDEKRESDIQQLEGEIRILNERTTVMESKMEEERDEEKKNEAITEKEELERRLTRVTNKRKVEKREMEELERRLTSVRNKRKREWRETEEMEESHRKEMEEMRESYDIEVWEGAAERNLMKIILTCLQKIISITKMEGEFNKQMEEKNREIKRMKDRLRVNKGKLMDIFQGAVERLGGLPSDSESEFEN